MKSQKFLVIAFLLAMLLCSGSVFAYGKGNSLANISYSLVTTDETGTGIVYTPQCFDCHLPIKIMYNGSVAPSSLSLNIPAKTNFDWTMNKLNISDDVNVTDIKYLKSVTTEEQILTQNATCNYTLENVTANQTVCGNNPVPICYLSLQNETVCYENLTQVCNTTEINFIDFVKSNCTNATYQLQNVTRKVWTSIFSSSLNLTKGAWTYIDIVGTRTPTGKIFSTDVIPKFYGFNLSELAWWNTSWISCRNLTITESSGLSVTDKPIEFNFTNLTGKLANNYDFRIISASCGNGGSEVPYQVIDSTSDSVRSVFKINMTANLQANWSVVWNNSQATNPNYADIITFRDNFEDVAINGTYWNVSKNDPSGTFSTSSDFALYGIKSAKASGTGGYYLVLTHAYSTQNGTLSVYIKETVNDYRQTLYLDSPSSAWTTIDRNPTGLANYYVWRDSTLGGAYQNTNIAYYSNNSWVRFMMIGNTTGEWLYINNISIRNYTSSRQLIQINLWTEGSGVKYFDEFRFYENVYDNPAQAYNIVLGTLQQQYGNKILDNLTYTGGGSLNDIPYLINGSSGFSLNSSAKIFAWTKGNLNGTNYIYYNNYDDYTIVNGTENTRYGHEVEKGNGTNYLSTSVWDSNYKMVLHFSEGTGSPAKDSTSNGNNGTISSWSPDGIVGNSFKETNSVKVAVADSSTLTLANGLTIEAWVKANSSYTKGYHGILQKDNTDSANAYWMRMRDIDGSAKIIQCAIGGAEITANLVDVSKFYDAWYYFVCSWNGTTIKIYENGILRNTTASATAPTDTSESLAIGCLQATGGGCQNWSYFGGLIDEVRISNISRSDDWILATYKSINNSVSQTGISPPYLSATFNFATFDFGTLTAGTNDNKAPSIDDSYNVTIDTNYDYSFSAKGTSVFEDGQGHSFAIGNLKMQGYNVAGDYNIESATVITTEEQLLGSAGAGDTPLFYVGWLSIPAGQYYGDYNATLTLTFDTVI